LVPPSLSLSDFLDGLYIIQKHAVDGFPELGFLLLEKEFCSLLIHRLDFHLGLRFGLEDLGRQWNVFGWRR